MNRWCSINKLLLKISQYSQENTFIGASFLIKLQAFSPASVLKRDSNTGQVFSCEYCEILEKHLF